MDVGGSKHFGVWPLTQAAQACFGTADWPVDRPVPLASVEFEVADADAVQGAADIEADVARRARALAGERAALEMRYPRLRRDAD